MKAPASGRLGSHSSIDGLIIGGTIAVYVRANPLSEISRVRRFVLRHRLSQDVIDQEDSAAGPCSIFQDDRSSRYLCCLGVLISCDRDVECDCMRLRVLPFHVVSQIMQLSERDVLSPTLVMVVTQMYDSPDAGIVCPRQDAGGRTVSINENMRRFMGLEIDVKFCPGSCMVGTGRRQESRLCVATIGT